MEGTKEMSTAFYLWIVFSVALAVGFGTLIYKKWRCVHEEWTRDKEELKEEERKESERYHQMPKNLPCILRRLRCLFLFLYFLSFTKWISGTKKADEKILYLDYKPYQCIERYVISWLFIDSIAATVIGLYNLKIIPLVWVFSYRLLDIFQSWVSQFILRSKWKAINVNRSLVLAFEGYIEITIIGAIIKYTYGQYRGNNFLDALYDSVNTMIANPGNRASPIQYVQIMFAVLFVAVVVQHVVGRLSSRNGG